MATTEEKSTATVAGAEQAPRGEPPVIDRRRRAHELMAAQLARIDHLEQQLGEQFEHLAEELAQVDVLDEAQRGESVSLEDHRRQLEERLAQLAAREAELNQVHGEHEQARIELGKLEQELRIRQALLDEAQKQQEAQRVALADAAHQLADAQAQLSAARDNQEQLRRELLSERQSAESARHSMQDARRRLARRLREQHSARLGELEQHKTKLKSQLALEHVEIETQLAAARAEAAQARAEAAQLRSALNERSLDRATAEDSIRTLEQELARARSAIECGTAQHKSALEELRTQMAQLQAALDERTKMVSQAEQRIREMQSQAEQLHQSLEPAVAEHKAAADEARRQTKQLQSALDERAAELARAQERIGALEGEARSLRDSLEQAAQQAAGAGQAVDREELARLRSERDSLRTLLRDTEAKLGEASKAEADSRNKDELQRRFEMAVEDLREMRRVNAELESKLANARTSGGGGGGAAAIGGGLDWESQKQRLLAALEADDAQDEESVAERVTMEGTIRITDQIVAQKDKEIDELKQQLAAGAPSAARGPDPAAVAEILERDELVRQEREKLEQLQAEWREKIGKAEIDISVERAKIARERMELEEKIRQHQFDAPPAPPDGSGAPQPGRSRGKWMTMLGLKDVDESEAGKKKK